MRTDGRNYEAKSRSHNFANAPQKHGEFYGQAKSRFRYTRSCEDTQPIIFALSRTYIISFSRRRVHRVVLQNISMGTIGMSRRGRRDLIHAKILTTPVHPKSLWRSIIYIWFPSLLQGFWKWRIWFLFSLTSSPFSFSIPPTHFLPPFSLFYSLIPNFLGAPPMAWHFTPNTHTYPPRKNPSCPNTTP